MDFLQNLKFPSSHIVPIWLKTQGQTNLSQQAVFEYLTWPKGIIWLPNLTLNFLQRARKWREVHQTVSICDISSNLRLVSHIPKMSHSHQQQSQPQQQQPPPPPTSAVPKPQPVLTKTGSGSSLMGERDIFKDIYSVGELRSRNGSTSAHSSSNNSPISLETERPAKKPAYFPPPVLRPQHVYAPVAPLGMLSLGVLSKHKNEFDRTDQRKLRKYLLVLLFWPKPRWNSKDRRIFCRDIIWRSWNIRNWGKVSVTSQADISQSLIHCETMRARF